MIPPDLSEALRILSEGSIVRLHAYYVSGSNEVGAIDCTEADDFCLKCCEAVVEAYECPELRVASFSSESDNLAFCLTCEAPLHVTLTEHGIEQELDHFLRLYPIEPDASPDEWEDFSTAVVDLPNDSPHWASVRERVTRAIRARLLATMEKKR